MNIPNVLGHTAVVVAVFPDSITLLVEGIEDRANQLITVNNSVLSKIPKLHETIVVTDYVQLTHSYSSTLEGQRDDVFVKATARPFNWLATDEEKEDYRLILQHALRKESPNRLGDVWEVTVEDMNAEYVRATIALNPNIKISYQLHSPELVSAMDEDENCTNQVSYTLQIEDGCPIAIFRKVKYRMSMVILDQSHYGNTAHDVAYKVREEVRTDPRSVMEGYSKEQMSDLLSSSDIYRGDAIVAVIGGQQYFDLYLAVNQHVKLPKWMDTPIYHKNLVLVRVGLVSASSLEHLRSYTQERVSGIREWVANNVHNLGQIFPSSSIYHQVTQWIFEGIGRKDESVVTVKTPHSNLKDQLKTAIDSIISNPDFESLLPITGKPTFWVVSDLESWVATSTALAELTDYQTQLYLIGYGNQFGGVKLSLAGHTDSTAYVERYNSTQFSVLAPVTYVFNTYPDSNLS